ncbi:MAG: hypothetical protein IPJ74_10320 [Saprospiraceae bacterium]|nr:hypothetical protein [Saprospiraceae bacterium]
MDKSALELLISSLDQELAPKDQFRLEEALAASQELRQEREEFLRMRELVADLRVQRSNEFVDELMSKLPQQKESGFWADIVFLSPKVAAACIIFVVVSLLGVYIMEGRLNSEIIIGVEQLTPEDAYSIQEQKVSKKREKEALPFEMPKKK